MKTKYAGINFFIIFLVEPLTTIGSASLGIWLEAWTCMSPTTWTTFCDCQRVGQRLPVNTSTIPCCSWERTSATSNLTFATSWCCPACRLSSSSSTGCSGCDFLTGKGNNSHFRVKKYNEKQWRICCLLIDNYWPITEMSKIEILS